MKSKIRAIILEKRELLVDGGNKNSMNSLCFINIKYF